jgi:excisionase family DNA binding protein
MPVQPASGRSQRTRWDGLAVAFCATAKERGRKSQCDGAAIRGSLMPRGGVVTLAIIKIECRISMMPYKQEDQPSIDELISLSEAADLSGLSPDHLRRLVREGELWGKKVGRNWVTTTRAIKDYLALNRKPGPKPKH